jgi:SET domain-containing protein
MKQWIGPLSVPCIDLIINGNTVMSELKKKLLDHLNNEVYCRLGVSKVHGIGVFAIKPIPKGVNPMKSKLKFKEVPIPHKELKGIPSSVKKQMKIFCYFDDDKFLVPSIGLNSMDMAIYLNHSKKPNVEFRKNGKLVALRAIKTGEELFMDYDINFGEKHIF